MKVNQITGVNYSYAKYGNINKNTVPQSDNSINSYNYGKNYAASNILFKGVSGGVPKVVRKASLRDKLAIAFNKIENNDFLILSNSFEEGKKTFQRCIPELANPIAKLVLMAVPGVYCTFGFEKNDNKIGLWNLGEDAVGVDYEIIDSGDTVDLTDHSVITFCEDDIDFSQKPKNIAELEVLSDFFLKEYDFTKQYDNAIEQHNNRILNEIITQKDKQKIKQATKAESKTAMDFSSIGGQDHIVEEIKRNIIFPIKYPEAFEGFNTNKGAIFYGPPGTGKSLMADIICSISGASCFKVAGAELDDKLVGESEKNWRDLHQKAVDGQPSIIFIDEMDAVGRERSGKDAYGDKVLNQILALMSEDEKEGRNIFWIGATNKLDSIDSAVTRSGRFGKHYEFLAPSTLKDVEQIFDIHTQKLQLSDNLNREHVFSKMLEYKTTGADIKVLIDDARTNAMERTGIFKSMDNGTYNPQMLDFIEITDEDFSKALEKFGKGKKTVKPIGFKK